MSDFKKKEIRTSVLLRRLVKAADLDEVMESHAQEMNQPPFHAYLNELCDSSNRVPEQVIRCASIERTYGHQLFNGTRKPSRDKVIQLAFGFALDLDGAQKLLQAAEKNLLYPKIKRDAAIIHCIAHRKDILETQAVLHTLGLTLLGGDCP
jgi:hypothetical protein